MKTQAGTKILMSTALDGRTEALNFLIDSGIDVNSRDSHDLTPLMYAALSGRTITVRSLLDKGADPLAVDMFGHTPRMWAELLNENQEVIRLLEQAETQTSFSRKENLYEYKKSN
jgi:ankyrin repeat protein